MKWFIYYLLIVNLIAFIMYGVDKFKAKHDMWRISENMLIGLAAIGGAVGAFVGMQIFRHKTKHLKFVIGVPVILILWIVGIVYLLNK